MKVTVNRLQINYILCFEISVKLMIMKYCGKTLSMYLHMFRILTV